MLKIDKIKDGIQAGDMRSIARAITLVEDSSIYSEEILNSLDQKKIDEALVLGITGFPGAGKSTLTSQIVTKLREKGRRVGVIAIDPSSPISGGAILGDRIRMMKHTLDEGVVIRSMATRGRLGGLCASAGTAVRIMASSGCNPIIIETVGVGQSEMDIIRLADITALVLAPGLGDDIQAMKAGVLEVADTIVINKADNPGADLLYMDMELIVRETKRKMLKTIASEGIGVSEFFDSVQDLYNEYKKTGVLEKRRINSKKLEIVDWAIEFLRPKLLEKISHTNLDGDPRGKAKEIVNILGA